MVEGLEAMGALQHPHLVRVVGWSLTEGHLCMFTEPCSGCGIEDVLVRFAAMDCKTVHHNTVQR